jgi:hypothetical protein
VRVDVMKASLPIRAYNVWHDRAVFHFLTQAEQRRDYVSTVTSAVEAAGHDIVSKFGPRFRLIESLTELHRTQFGTTQQFLFCHFIFES